MQIIDTAEDTRSSPERSPAPGDDDAATHDTEPPVTLVEDLPTPLFWPVGFKNTFRLVQRIVTGQVANDMTAARSLHALVRKQLAVAARDGFAETHVLLLPETGEQANFELLVETVLLRGLAEAAPADADAREELALLVGNWIGLPGLQEPTERFLRYLKPRLWKAPA